MNNENRPSNFWKYLVAALIVGVLILVFVALGGINLSRIPGLNSNTSGENTSIFNTDSTPTGDNTNGSTSGTTNNMVGGGALNPCVENTALQIEPLVENNSVVPNAFMGLDLNRTEVTAGLRYVLTVPADTYVQYFEAWSGQTWEAVGPTTVTATAWTSWCNNAGWLTSVGYNTQAGNHRQLNANNLPEPVGSWVPR